jgi:glycosyltransferase involved in cell wall biosynthesis
VKILYVITAAEFGGASLHVLQLMEHMAKQGHEVGLVAAPESRLMEKAKALGVKIFSNPHFVRPIRPWKDFRALWPVFQAIRAFDPDIVHAHSTKAGYAARFACAILRKRVIFTAHGWAFTEGRGLMARKLLALAERLAAKITLKIICVSRHDRELALQWKVARPEQLVVIHNGIDPEPFLEADGASLRKELELHDEPVLTFVGRLAPPKDPLTLIDAVKRLSKGILLVVGGGELRSQVESHITENHLEKRVKLLGQRSDIPQILEASDVFVLSSRWEGLPYTIIEAMMAGLPVVATKVGGVPELVENGVTGFLVPPKDPETLAQALQKLIEDPELRKRMGRAGREKALREFTLDRMLHETERVYREVLEEIKAKEVRRTVGKKPSGNR